MNTSQNRKASDCIPLKLNSPITIKPIKSALPWCGQLLAVLTTVLIVSAATQNSFIASAQAEEKSDVRLTLTVTGPNTTKAGTPLKDINIRLNNPGAEAPDSRLRLFVHDAADRDINLGDIKIAILEADTWNDLTMEAIDGGVMGAIAEPSKVHNNNHKRGGFAIAKEAKLTWKIQLTFSTPGSYTVVGAVSPNNGSKHLAQPVKFNVEVL